MELEQMKQKYASVLSAIQREQVRLSHVHIQDNKLFIQGVAPSAEAKNKVWDQIKAVNPNWAQELTADITIDSNGVGNSTAADSAAVPGRNASYTVRPGDTLSKISQQFYGNANRYMKIFDANRDVLTDPNKIEPGQSLQIPQ
jgi:nucleoid-associated protein YgaU